MITCLIYFIPVLYIFLKGTLQREIKQSCKSDFIFCNFFNSKFSKLQLNCEILKGFGCAFLFLTTFTTLRLHVSNSVTSCPLDEAPSILKQYLDVFLGPVTNSLRIGSQVIKKPYFPGCHAHLIPNRISALFVTIGETWPHVELSEEILCNLQPFRSFSHIFYVFWSFRTSFVEMFLQYYLNENGDRVYTLKVSITLCLHCSLLSLLNV